MPGPAGGTLCIGTNPLVGVNFPQTATNIPSQAAPPLGSTAIPLVNAQRQQQPGLATILPTPAQTAAPNLVTGKRIYSCCRLFRLSNYN